MVLLLTQLKDQHGKHGPNSTRTPAYIASYWEKETIHRPAPVQNFSLQKKWGPQRKDFGGGYGFPCPEFYRAFVSTTGLESFSLKPEKFSKRFFFRWWLCTLFSSLSYTNNEFAYLSAPKSQRSLRFAIAMPIADPRNRVISETRQSNVALRFKGAMESLRAQSCGLFAAKNSCEKKILGPDLGASF